MGRIAIGTFLVWAMTMTACSFGSSATSASAGGSASGSSDGSAATTPSGSETGGSPSVSAPPPVSDPCRNDYFPVVEGATWRYQRTALGRTTPIAQSFEAIGDAGFTVLQLLAGGGERDVWTCGADGLVNVQQYATGPHGGPPPPGTVDFHHFRSRGVTVPTELSPGSNWKQVVTSRARFNVAGTWYDERQVVKSTYRAADEETITTPAGTFDALKVLITTNTHKTAPDFGQGIDLRSGTSTMQWWAPGVGIVRSIIDAGSGSTTTIVLVAYDVPGG
jgi:hypothetical protein